MKQLFDFIDTRHIIRRICLFVVLYLQIEVIFWSMNTAHALDMGQIGAVTGPMSVLFGAVLKFYSESRNNGHKD